MKKIIILIILILLVCFFYPKKYYYGIGDPSFVTDQPTIPTCFGIKKGINMPGLSVYNCYGILIKN